MDKEELRLELEYLFSGYLRSQGLELVELIYRYEGKDLILRVLVDKPLGGITMDECTRVNREIGEMLDEKDIIPGRYVLEISSPGLDRPLIAKNDFLRCLNKEIKIFLKEKIEEKLEWDGFIVGVNDNALSLDAKGETLNIPLSIIAKAKQII